MGALADILPFTAGLLVSPLPVVAVIILMVSQGGLGKATVFVCSWLLASFGFLIALVALFNALSADGEEGPPSWAPAVALAIGIVLLLIAAVSLYQILRPGRKQQRRADKGPGWLQAMDRMKPRGVILLAAALVIANPVNASMLLAAALGLHEDRLSVGEAILPAIIFVVIGSLTVLLPYLVALGAKEKAAPFLQRLRVWLVRYNSLMTFWVTFVFGVIFVVKGLR
jgi:hypothetical protein